MNESDRIAALERELAQLRARTDIEDLMARWQALLSGGEGHRIPAELFAQDAQDAAIEYGASGQYIGLKKLATFFEKDVLPGQFAIAALASPQIAVDSDALRAHGTWTLIGTELDAGELGPASPACAEEAALLSSRAPDGKAYRAEWVWQRVSAAFLFERGVWKLHRLHIFDLLRCPMDSDFVRFAAARWQTDGLRLDRLFTSNVPFAPGELPENLANGPTTSHWQYRTDALPEFPE